MLFVVLLQKFENLKRINMPTLPLNVGIVRKIKGIADNESFIKRMAKHLKSFAFPKHADDTCMTMEEFYAKIDCAEKRIEQGEGTSFESHEKMNTWLNSL